MRRLMEHIRTEIVQAGKDFAALAINLTKFFCKTLKWLVIAMLWTFAGVICLAIVGAFVVTLGYLVWTKVVPDTVDATTWIVDILFSFPVEFAILIGIYFALFFFGETSIRYTYDRALGIMPPPSFKDECGKTLEKSHKDHVRWWAWAPTMFVITLGIAWAHPGPALLVGFFDQASGWGSSFTSSWHVHHILYGNEPMAAIQTHQAAVQQGWFWWHAAWWLFVITIVVGLVVFFENIWRVMGVAAGVISKNLGKWWQRTEAERAARVQQLAATPPIATSVTPSVPPVTGGTPGVNVATTVTSPGPTQPQGIFGKVVAASFLAELFEGLFHAVLHEWRESNEDRRERRVYA